jgi:hypothetical protein
MSTSTYAINFEDVKRQVTMEQVIAFAGIQTLKRKTPTRWEGNCPFCKAHDCFKITADGGKDGTGAFNCFKCPAGGDKLELVSLSRGYPRRDRKGTYEAAKALHEQFRTVPQPQAQNSNRSHSSPQEGRRAGYDPEAYAKGLDPAHPSLEPLGLAAETIQEWRGGYARSGSNRGHLALPVTRIDGTIVAHIGRRIDEHTPRLVFPLGFRPEEHFFGLSRVKQGPLVVVADPLQVLRAYESDPDANAIAYLTDELTQIQLLGITSVMDERQCPTVRIY